jgi:hypothetical protein
MKGQQYQQHYKHLPRNLFLTTLRIEKHNYIDNNNHDDDDNEDNDDGNNDIDDDDNNDGDAVADDNDVSNNGDVTSPLLRIYDVTNAILLMHHHCQ